MKIRVIVFFSCLILICTISQAQLRIGIAGGPQLAKVPGNHNPGWDTLSYNHDNRQGWRAGLLADIRLAPQSLFYLQTGMFFSNKGQRFSITYDTTTNGVNQVKALQYVNYLEVPLNLFLKFDLGKKTKVMIGGGPYAGFLYSGKERREIYFQNGSTQLMQNTDLKVTTSPGTYSNIEYGWNGMAGFEFGRVILSAYYSQGISDFYQSTAPEGTFKHQAMAAALGYYLFYSPDKTARDKNSKDKDDDGVPDKLDACPTQAGSTTANGCPDADMDSIADKVDKCPEIAGLAKYKGCPIPDKDKDGIPDAEDKCPDVAGVKQFGGCVFPDKDKDGVPDTQDKCPELAGVAKHNGCPAPDTDNDGVNDDEDKCPKVKGVTSNKGCPELKKDIVKKVESMSRSIHFKYKSVLLLPSSIRTLNNLVKILKDNPELNVLIEGHVSDDGANHDKLSYARAYSVKIYFESKGISPFRLKAVGLGATKPAVKGNSERAMSKNRRVEMKLSNHE